MAYHPFRHLGLKFLAIGLAVLLWFTVARDPIVERNLRIPLNFQNIPEGLTLVGAPPDSVEVRARGSSGIVSRLQPDDVVAVLDLRPARVGRRLFQLPTADVQVPFGVQIEQVAPSSVTLEFERVASKQVPVVPSIEGEPASGFVVGTVRVEPATVEILGPESRLRLASEATTEPVSVVMATETVQAVASIGTSDAALRLRTPASATVTVTVVPGPLERTLRDVLVQVRTGRESAAVEVIPPVVSVRVSGVRDTVVDLHADSIEAFVDLADREPGQHELPVQIVPPPQVEVVGVSPSTVILTVK